MSEAENRALTVRGADADAHDLADLAPRIDDLAGHPDAGRPDAACTGTTRSDSRFIRASRMA